MTIKSVGLTAAMFLILAGCKSSTSSSGDTETDDGTVEDTTEDPIADPAADTDVEDTSPDPVEDMSPDPVEDTPGDPVEDPIEDPDAESPPDVMDDPDAAGDADVEPDTVACTDFTTIPTTLSWCVPPTTASGIDFCDNPSVTACTGGSTGCQMDVGVTGIAGVEGSPGEYTVTLQLTGFDEIVPASTTTGDCDSLTLTASTIDVTIYTTVDETGETYMMITDLSVGLDTISYSHSASSDGDQYMACQVLVATLAISGSTIVGPVLRFAEAVLEMFEIMVCLDCAGTCPGTSTCSGDPAVCRQHLTTCAPLDLACWTFL